MWLSKYNKKSESKNGLQILLKLHNINEDRKGMAENINIIIKTWFYYVIGLYHMHDAQKASPSCVELWPFAMVLKPESQNSLHWEGEYSN